MPCASRAGAPQRHRDPQHRLYIGVPVQLSDGSVHGSLCCASNEPRPDLGDTELRFMQVLAGIVAARLERAHGSMVRLARRFAAAQPAD